MGVVLAVDLAQSLKNLLLLARIQLFFHLELPFFVFDLPLEDKLILKSGRPRFELSLQLFDLQVVPQDLLLPRTHLHRHPRLESVSGVLHRRLVGFLDLQK